MALKNSAAAAQAPAFEPMETTQPAAGTTTPENLTKAPEAPVAAAATTAVAPRAANAVAIRPEQTSLSSKQGVWSTEDIESLGYGGLPRMIATQGSLKLDDDRIGNSAVLEVLSWNLRYMAVTNTNDAEAKSMVRVSYDNKTISGDGGDIHAYVEGLKAEGYTKASVKTYGDLWGRLISTEKAGVLPKKQMVQIQMSPETLKQFKRLQLEQAYEEADGAEPLKYVKLGAQAKSFADNDFTIITFERADLDPVAKAA
jgi:hypothetical protein